MIRHLSKNVVRVFGLCIPCHVWAGLAPSERRRFFCACVLAFVVLHFDLEISDPCGIRSGMRCAMQTLFFPGYLAALVGTGPWTIHLFLVV